MSVIIYHSLIICGHLDRQREANVSHMIFIVTYICIRDFFNSIHTIQRNVLLSNKCDFHIGNIVRASCIKVLNEFFGILQYLRFFNKHSRFILP